MKLTIELLTDDILRRAIIEAMEREAAKLDRREADLAAKQAQLDQEASEQAPAPAPAPAAAPEFTVEEIGQAASAFIDADPANLGLLQGALSELGIATIAGLSADMLQKTTEKLRGIGVAL